MKRKNFPSFSFQIFDVCIFKTKWRHFLITFAVCRMHVKSYYNWMWMHVVRILPPHSLCLSLSLSVFLYFYRVLKCATIERESIEKSHSKTRKCKTKKLLIKRDYGRQWTLSNGSEKHQFPCYWIYSPLFFSSAKYRSARHEKVQLPIDFVVILRLYNFWARKYK